MVPEDDYWTFSRKEAEMSSVAQLDAGTALRLCHCNLFIGLDTCSLDEQQAFVNCGATYQSCLKGRGVELGKSASLQRLEIKSYAGVSACVCEFSNACLASSQCQVGTRGAASHEMQCMTVGAAFVATTADCGGPSIALVSQRL